MHNIETYTYPATKSKKTITAELDEHVAFETRYESQGHGCTGGIRWDDTTICLTEEEAEKWIKSHDKGWYDCLAVKYQQPISDGKSAKLAELQKKSQEAFDAYIEKDHELYPQTRTSAFIGCSKCGSKLATKLLRSNHCPVCRADLRPDTTLKAIAAAEAKWQKAVKAHQDYINTHNKKELYWLVKIEYHT